MKENELILCVVHNGKLHQVMLSDEECSLLESALSGIMPDKTLKVSSTPICDVEIKKILEILEDKDNA